MPHVSQLQEVNEIKVPTFSATIRKDLLSGSQVIFIPFVNDSSNSR